MKQSAFFNGRNGTIGLMMVLLAVLGFWRCDDLDVFDFPTEVSMKKNLDYPNLSVAFEATIKGVVADDDHILEHGFVWSKSNKFPMPGTDSTLYVQLRERDDDVFSFDTTATRFSYEESNYYVRAFIRYEDSIYVVRNLRDTLDDNGYYFWPVENFNFRPIEVSILNDTVINGIVVVKNLVIKRNTEAFDALGTIEEYGLIWSDSISDLTIDDLGKPHVYDTSNMSNSEVSVTYQYAIKVELNTRYYFRAYAVTNSGKIIEYSEVRHIDVYDGWILRKNNVNDPLRAFVSGVAVWGDNPTYNFVGLGCLRGDCGTEFKLWFVNRDAGDTLNLRWRGINVSDELQSNPRASGVAAMNSDSFFIYGLGYSEQSKLRNDFFIYNIFTGVWSEVDAYPTFGRVNSVAFTVYNNDKNKEETFIGLGAHFEPGVGASVRSDFHVLSRDVTGNWRWELNAFDWGHEGLSGAVAVTAENYAYVLGGTTSVENATGIPLKYSDVSKAFYRFNPENKIWGKLDVDTGFEARAEAIGFYLNGKLYFGLGRGADKQLLRDFWSCDLKGENWCRLEDFPTGRAAGNAMVIDGKAFVGGGLVNVSGEEVASKEFWEYIPSIDDCPE